MSFALYMQSVASEAGAFVVFVEAAPKLVLLCTVRGTGVETACRGIEAVCL